MEIEHFIFLGENKSQKINFHYKVVKIEHEVIRATLNSLLLVLFQLTGMLMKQGSTLLPPIFPSLLCPTTLRWLLLLRHRSNLHSPRTTKSVIREHVYSFRKRNLQ